MNFVELVQELINPEKLIHAGGLLLVLIVIFTENGLFFGFFLPGDTLLFTAGLLSATGKFNIPIPLLVSSVSVAAMLGNWFGYYFGNKVGRRLFERKESILFKRRYVEAAEIFFNKYGGMALVMGRFLPIIRTFAPIFAGIVSFNFQKFLLYNIFGGLLWVFSMTLSGYYLGILFPHLKDNLEYVILGIIIITWIPVITTYFREQAKKATKS